MKTAKVSTLKHYYRNPRRGDVDAVAASLEAFGQFKPIVVNKGTITGRRNEVLAGNHTLKAARRLGWTELQVEIVDVDEETAAAIVVTDNRTADKGSYDTDILNTILQGLTTPEGTGYSSDDIEDILIRATPAPETPAAEGDDRWEQASRRSLIIEYPIAQFAWMVEKLHDLAKTYDTKSNAATARKLLEEYTK